MQHEGRARRPVGGCMMCCLTQWGPAAACAPALQDMGMMCCLTQRPPAAACAPALQDTGGDPAREQGARVLEGRAAGARKEAHRVVGSCARWRLALPLRVRALLHSCS
jgi:hypothetical protein